HLDDGVCHGGSSLKEIIAHKETVVEEASWCKEGRKLLKDAWEKI
ncbi:putative general secretion pathway protein G, partial [Chlamydia pneumoniae B21]